VKEAALGAAVVALFVGVVIGRATERARRSYKDYGVAKGTVTTSRKVAFGAARKAAGALLLITAILVALFIGAINLPR